MSGPWEDFKPVAAPAAESGPWSDFGKQPSVTPALRQSETPPLVNAKGERTPEPGSTGEKIRNVTQSIDSAGVGVLRAGASVLDMAAGIPSSISKVLAESVARATFATQGWLTGETLSRKQINVAAQMFGEDFVAGDPLLNAPVSRVLDWAISQLDESGGGNDPSVVDKAMGKVTELIALGAEKAEQRTGVPGMKEDLQLATEVLMNRYGVRGVRAGMQPGQKKAPLTPEEGRKTADEILKKYEELKAAQEPPKDPRRQWRDGVRQAQAESRAYELMKSDADAKAVEKEIAAAKKRGVPLEEAMDKIRKRRADAEAGFSQIPEEVIREDGTFAPHAKEALLRKGAEPSQTELDLRAKARGEPTNRGLMLGLGGAVTAAALIDHFGGSDEDRAMAAVGAAVLSMKALEHLPDATPLGAIRDRSAYTLKTLDRLPQNRFEFTREQVMQQLNRADVGKAEKDVVLAALGDKSKITAKELALGIKQATGDFELTPKEHTDGGAYEDYGLERIGRDSRDITGDEPWIPEDATVEEVNRLVAEHKKPNPPPARTTVYQSPLELGDANHFSDPNYFAHTRSFDEGGVRHVVEVQSDLAQKAGKALTEEERLGLQTRLQALEQHNRELAEARDRAAEEYTRIRKQSAWVTPEARAAEQAMRELDYQRDGVDAQIAEVNSKLKGAGSVDPIRPILKDWWKRIIREEMAQAQEARASRLAEDAKLESEIADAQRRAQEEANPQGWVRGKERQYENHVYDLGVMAMDLRNGHISEGTARQYLLQIEKEMPSSARERWKRYYEENADETEGFLRPTGDEIGAKWGNEYASNFVNVMHKFLSKELGLSKSWTQHLEHLISQRGMWKGRLEPTPKTIRFATADTVAKVEGWPHQGDGIDAGLIERRRAYERGAGFDAETPMVQETNRLEQQLQESRTNPRFNEQHQGIYDRYRRDIEKFLRSEFKARDYTDSAGHTWLEVDLPEPKGGRRGPTQMFGAADPKLLAAVGGATAGALLAAKLEQEDKLEAAIAGGLAGAAVSLLPRYVEYIKTDWKNALRDTAGVGLAVGGLTALDKDHPAEGAMIGMIFGSTKVWPKARIPQLGKLNIDETINLRNGAIAAREREVGNLGHAIRTIVPDASRREAISRALDRGDLRGLSADEQRIARVYRNVMDSWGEAAKDAGVIKDLIENYVTHIVERTGGNEQTLASALKQILDPGQGGGASGATPYGKHRKYSTFGELQSAIADTGLQVKTLDLADIVEAYGRSMARAIENKRMFRAFEQAKDAGEGGTPFIAESFKAPRSYKEVPHPQLRGYRVHPDLEEPLKFALGGRSNNTLVRGALAASLAQKRLAVAGSFFHAMNLGVAHVGAQGLRGVADLLAETKRLYGKDYTPPIAEALRKFREGGNGDTIDKLIRGGLHLEPISDVDRMALTKVGEAADKAIERVTGLRQGAVARTLGAAEKLQQKTFDAVTWDYLHTGLKALTASRLFEEALLKNPRVPPERLAEQIASHVNKTYGGIDWYRMAAETETAWGRKWAFAAYSPAGRTALQILMFAPDWTISTFKAFSDALPGKSKNPLTQALAQKYVLRTAIMYATAMNGLNLAFSGHNIWENEDPLMIDLGDGRKMQAFKHAAEGPEWLKDPRKTAFNKTNWVFREAVMQLTGREYISAKGAPPIESPTGHLLENFIPFAGKGLVDKDKTAGEALTSGALGMVGVNIYGKTDEQKELSRERKREERRRKLEKKQ